MRIGYARVSTADQNPDLQETLFKRLAAKRSLPGYSPAGAYETQRKLECVVLAGFVVGEDDAQAHSVEEYSDNA